MTNETHELATEFPQFKEQIHQLKTHSAHFARLFDEYHKITREIGRVAQEIETTSDAHTEALKKKRLQLKDELFAILKKGAA